MKNFGYFQAIPMSFYSRKLYQDVVENWRAGVLIYLLILLSISWIALSFNMQKKIEMTYQSLSEEFVPQLPPLKIENGILKTPVNHPYLIRYDDQVVAIVDTSGKYKTLKNTTAEVLVTKQDIVYRQKFKSLKSYHFPADLNTVIVPSDLQKIIGNYVAKLWIILIPFSILFSFLYRCIQVTVYSVLGELFSVLSRIPLTYGEVFRITSIAITPNIVIGTLMDFFKINFSHSWVFYFGLSIAYIIFGIYAARKKYENT